MTDRPPYRSPGYVVRGFRRLFTPETPPVGFIDPRRNGPEAREAARPKRLRVGPGHVVDRCPECEGRGVEGTKDGNSGGMPCENCEGVGYLNVNPHGPFSWPRDLSAVGFAIRAVVRVVRYRAGLDLWTGERLETAERLADAEGVE